VKLPRRLLRSLALLALAAAVLGAGLLWWRPAPVSMARAVTGPAVAAVYATGSVEPTVMLPIAPRVAGTLAELHADEGSHVSRGQDLARLEDSDLSGTVDELGARARYARDQFERTRELVERGFVSPTELDRTRTERDAAEASLRRASAQRGFMHLVSPADGTIIRRDGEVGQYVPAGQAVFTLACCAPLRVTADVDEEDITRVHAGQKVVLRADALPGRVLEGHVSAVTPKGDPVARSYRVRIALAEPGALRVGMTVEANLVYEEHAQAVLVPSAAVHEGAVWTVEDGRLHRRTVRSGISGPERTEILEGLAAGALVATGPAASLREGRRVRADESPGADAAAAAVTAPRPALAAPAAVVR
jgi:RND family efflux transporter MFP subunit